MIDTGYLYMYNYALIFYLFALSLIDGFTNFPLHSKDPDCHRALDFSEFHTV